MREAATARIPGIHHVTAICGDPQRNADFYVGVLGLRLVKRTVNFDNPGTCHLYYGDRLGSPGSILTFFAWVRLPMATVRARQGTGQIAAVAFGIPDESIEFWMDRLAATAVDVRGPETRLGETMIRLVDPDGLPLELVARPGRAPRVPWLEGPVPPDRAILGLAGVTLTLAGYERTARLLTATMGCREAGSDGARVRFLVGEGGDEAAIDLLCEPEGEPGRVGIGGVHHIAWRAPSGAAQGRWRQVLADAGHDVTSVIDRRYFASIYFREPGGVLFEIATDSPGFTVDEAPEALGVHLALPPWLEPRRAWIEARLPSVRIPSAGRSRGGDRDGE